MMRGPRTPPTMREPELAVQCPLDTPAAQTGAVEQAAPGAAAAAAHE